MSEAVTDEIYYAHAGNLSFLRRISAKAREENYRLFQKVMRPGPETTKPAMRVSLPVLT